VEQQTKLERLVMLEVSGVDDPANQLPGWMVSKAAGGTVDQQAAALVNLENDIKAEILGYVYALQRLGPSSERDKIVEQLTELLSVRKSANRDKMMSTLTRLLNLIGRGVEVDDATKDALVAKARKLLAESEVEKDRHAHRDHAGRFHRERTPLASDRAPFNIRHGGAVLPQLGDPDNLRSATDDWLGKPPSATDIDASRPDPAIDTIGPRL
jgi:hypothetical protein